VFSAVWNRDIKPSNLLLCREDTKYSVKLADFGLAKNFENAGFSGMTRDGATLGTLAYMAPEQVIDARRATPSVDIYSAGATLYSLIAGRPPHQLGSPGGVAVVFTVPIGLLIGAILNGVA
jgi:eukaryotic-like serine/threonine-protein kinase